MSPGTNSSVWRRVAAASAIGLALAACSVEDSGSSGDEGAEGGGEMEMDENTGSVEISGAVSGEEGEAFAEIFSIAGESTGIDAQYTGSDAFETEVIVAIEGGNPPDIAQFPQPGAVIEQAANGNAIALEDLGVDVAELEDRFGEYLMSLGEYEGKHYGWPDTINFKSAVWYNVPAWEEAGWGEPPTTWDELLTLSTEIAESGTSPWCLGTGSDAATGWPATDWMEDIVLRSQGTDAYDQWVEGELDFASDEITAAAEQFGEVVFGEAGGTPFVFGGHESITGTDFRDAPDPMFSDPPNCYMHRQATFIPAFFPEGLEAETDYNFFPFPDIDGNSGTLMAGGLSAIFEPRQEIVDFMLEYTSPEVGCEYGSRDATTAISANFNVDLECEENPIIRQAAEELQTSLQEGNARFDASDLMPPSVGSGEFWNGMNNYTDDGPDNLQDVLSSIDAAWPENDS